MDTSDISIKFDKDGVCDHCNSFINKIVPNWPKGLDAKLRLESIVKKIKADGIGKDFDCIIGLSGGIDSSYLAYVAKEMLGLRPLLFHVDGGWNSRIAVNNIEKIVDGLGLDLYTEVIDWDEMRDLQLAFFKSGVPHIDTPQDHAFFATMYKFAEKYNIKNILTGANLSTECIRNPLEWMYYQSDSVQLKDIHKKFGQKPLRTFPIMNILSHKLYLPYIKKIKVLRILDLIDYDKDFAIAELSKRFGWESYPQKHFESIFTRFYEGYWLPTKFGYDTRRVQFSSLILTGQMTRVESLKTLETKSYDENLINSDIKYIAKKLEIDIGDLNKFLSSKNKSYLDYRSQAYLYFFGAKVLKFFNIEIGGKR